MKHRPIQRGFALLTICAVASLAAACIPATVPAPAVPLGHFQFKAIQTVVNSSNDKGVCVFGVCVPPADDEPSVINIGFSVKIGVANSATAQVVVGDDPNSGIFDQGPGEGGTQTYSGGQQATVDFPGVPMLDVGDLAFQSNHLEVVGVWAWKIENDFIGVGDIANTAAAAIKAGLNSTLATASLPSDTSQIANSIVSAITSNIGGLLLTALNFLEANIPVLNIASDDAMGSAMYIGLGVRGTLASAINFVTANAALPNPLLVLDNFPVLGNIKVPPDIGPSKIFALGTTGNLVDSSTNPGVQGQHTTTYTFNAA